MSSGSAFASELAGCPGAEHIAWVLAACAPGAADMDAADLARHVLGDATASPRDHPMPQWSREQAGGPEAVAALNGWRISAFGDIVVTWSAPNGRQYDLLTSLDPATGLLSRMRTMRTSSGIDIGAKPIADLTDAEWAGVRGVFAAGFPDADPQELNHRIALLSTIALGWKDGEILGFSAVGMIFADLPMIGRRSFMDTGLFCTLPAARQLGLSNAIGNVALQAAPRPGPNEFAVLRFVTPVAMRAVFRFGRAAWPGASIAEVAANMAHPTACQKAVGAALAALIGAQSYDAEHWVIRTHESLGETTVHPEDLEPEYAQLFAHVDAAKGDTLLGVFWWSDPPDVWWT